MKEVAILIVIILLVLGFALGGAAAHIDNNVALTFINK